MEKQYIVYELPRFRPVSVTECEVTSVGSSDVDTHVDCGWIWKNTCEVAGSFVCHVTVALVRESVPRLTPQFEMIKDEMVNAVEPQTVPAQAVIVGLPAAIP